VSVADFLAALRRRDIEIRLDGERLRCNAPAGTLVPELRAQLQSRKGEIVAFLRAAATLRRQQRAIVPLQPHGSRSAVFAVPGHNGDVFCYRAFAHCLGSDQPFFGLQPPGLDKESRPLASVEELATYFAAQIRAFQPEGPYIVAGYCAGGTIAFEIAQQLEAQGAAVRFVALIASPWPHWYRALPQFGYRMAREIERGANHVRAMATLPHGKLSEYIAAKIRQRRQRREEAAAANADPALEQRRIVEIATLAAVRRYMPQPYGGRVSLFVPDGNERRAALLRWREVAANAELYPAPPECDGDQMLRPPHVADIAAQFQRCAALPGNGADGPPETAARPRPNAAGEFEAMAANLAQPVQHA